LRGPSASEAEDADLDDLDTGESLGLGAGLRRRVVTSRAAGTYQFEHCVDKTFAGVWKRAPRSGEGKPAPFTKMTLSKLIVLPNQKARESYMKQQSQFVVQRGQGDECAEFSTSIRIPGFRSRMLAERPVKGVLSTKLFRLHNFWIFTLLGLTVPYRIWFADHCDEVRVTITKELFTDAPASAEKTTLTSWLPSAPFSSKGVSADSEVRAEDAFTSLMQSLRLYAAKNETSEERQNATTALMKDVEAASYGERMVSEAASTLNKANTTTELQ